MNKILVTQSKNNYAKYQVMSWDDFAAAAQSQDGINIDKNDELYIDIACVPGNNFANAIAEGIPVARFIQLDKEVPIPGWFDLPIADLPQDLDINEFNDDELMAIGDAMSVIENVGEAVTDQSSNYGRIITFGSAKGGSGKTFTSIITAVYYAKDHPNQRVCLLDLDVEEPQVAAVLHARANDPTIKNFYGDYCIGNKDFKYLERYKYNRIGMPSNLDFYLTPRDNKPINDDEFWLTLMTNLFCNYDLVIVDTGTTYMTTNPIIHAYKIADKICLVSMVSIASSVAVNNQLKLLSGEKYNKVYAPEDGLAQKINLVLTNWYKDKIALEIERTMGAEYPILAKFGYLHEDINRMEIMGEWNNFDDWKEFRNIIKKVYS